MGELKQTDKTEINSLIQNHTIATDTLTQVIVYQYDCCYE